MEINNLIDREFTTTSVLEDLRDFSRWFGEKEYLAIADEESNITGIITLKDLNANPEGRNVMDCDTTKPRVNLGQNILQVYELMKDASADFLPVYDRHNFVGVITLTKIMEGLIEAIGKAKYTYQQVIHDLRNPLGNIQALLGITESVTGNENLELLKLCHSSSHHAMDILDDLVYTELEENKPLNKLRLKWALFIIIKEYNLIT